MKSYGLTIHMKPVQQYFHMALFSKYEVSTFESVHEFLWCDHSYETCLEVLLYGSMDTLISQEFSKAWALAVKKSWRKKSLKQFGLPIKLITGAI